MSIIGTGNMTTQAAWTPLQRGRIRVSETGWGSNLVVFFPHEFSCLGIEHPHANDNAHPSRMDVPHSYYPSVPCRSVDHHGAGGSVGQDIVTTTSARLAAGWPALDPNAALTRRWKMPGWDSQRYCGAGSGSVPDDDRSAGAASKGKAAYRQRNCQTATAPTHICLSSV